MSVVTRNLPSELTAMFSGMLPTFCVALARGEIALPVTKGGLTCVCSPPAGWPHPGHASAIKGMQIAREYTYRRWSVIEAAFQVAFVDTTQVTTPHRSCP